MTVFSHMIELAIEVETRNCEYTIKKEEVLDALRRLIDNMEQDFDWDRFQVTDSILISKDPRCDNG